MATRQDGPAARPANPPSQGRSPIPASVLGRVGGRILDPGKGGALEPRRRRAFGEDIDPDDFMGGFGLWSGTSFAAPVLAAQLAGRTLKGGTLDTTDARSAVTRGWAAITRELGWRRPRS